MSKERLPKINELLGISLDYHVKRYRRYGDYDLAHITREPRDRQCPCCGVKGHIKGRRWRKVWHTPVQSVPLMLKVEVVRFQCPKCKKTWSDSHEIISETSIHMTKDVADAVLVDLMDKMSVAATSNKEGPSCHMVNCVLDRAIVDNVYLPRVLCIDEFKANTDEGKMAVCIADGDTGTLVEILPRLTTKCIDGFFSRFDAKERTHVAYYCCDMSGMFIAAKKKWFPEAVLCIDRFHVVKLVTTAFNDVRKRIQNDEGVPAAARKELRGAWKLFLTKRRDLEQIDIDYAARLADQRITIATTLDLTDEEMAEVAVLKPREPRLARVDRLLGLDADLKCAYKLMHLFRNWSDMAWCAEKRDSFTKWVSLATRSGIPEMKQAAKTLKTNKEGVLNGYRHNKTNATAEGLNNSIKVLKRTSYGFKAFKRMRRRCLLSLGYYRIIKRGIKLSGVRTDLN